MDARYIIVTWEFEGFHSWIKAPDDVAFLRDRHRHLFKCKAEIEVLHGDRELEFFQVKRFLQSFSMDELSCEEFAERYVWALQDKYGSTRRIRVEVWEDGENAGVYVS
jgi:hypothetical protein